MIMTFEEFMHEPANSLYALTEEELEKIKRKISVSHLNQLKKIAKEAMEMPLQSVTYKEKAILTDNPHEYESFSLYSWPNPDTETGLPYIKKDGKINPEHLKGDKGALRKMSYACYYLAILYYITREKQYEQRLNEHLQCFFLDEETKMLANLNHGQAMLGVNTGQRGIIDFAVSFGYVISILQCLRNQKLLNGSVYEGLKKWLTEFQQWLIQSDFGKEMVHSSNNHALVYDFLQIVIALFIDDYYTLVLVKQRYMNRVSKQIQMNGYMPLEMKRVNSRSYYFMNLKLFFEIGNLLYLDLDRVFLLQKAMQYYLSHNSKERWEFSQEIPFEESYDNYLFYLAKKYFGFSNLSLWKTKTLQYVLFADLYGEQNEN